MAHTFANVGDEAATFGIRRTKFDPRAPTRWIVTCSCGATETSGFPMDMNPHALAKKFGERGWLLTHGKSPVCPECRKVTRMSKQAIGPDPKIARKVYAMLDDHFDEVKRLYRQGWNDARIAKEIGTALELVVDIRAKAYGELAEDPVILAFREDLELLRMELTEWQAKAQVEFAALMQRIADAEAKIPTQIRRAI